MKKKQQPKTRAQKVTHHAKRVIQITPKFVHGMFAGAFIGALVVGVVSLVNPANALSISSSRDCTDNAILRCGALTTQELREKYHSGNPGAAAIYSAYGISSADINNMDSLAVVGKVHKDGTVTVNGNVVATNAASSGRQYISGSQKVVKDGVTFYSRATSVSFRSSSIDAFVVMKDGAFAYAILGTCGNPIVAKSVSKPTTPTPPAPTPPAPTPENPQPVTDTPLPAPAPVELAAAPTEPAELPKAGPAALLVVLGLAIVGGYVFHVGHRHVQHRRHNKRHGHA